MTDDRMTEIEIALEAEARGVTIKKFHSEHEDATKSGEFADTFLGAHFITNYLNPVADGIGEWMKRCNAGKAGRRVRASVLLDGVEPPVLAFLTLKAIFNKLGVYNESKPCTFTGLAIFTAGLIHDELRLREFDAEYTKLSRRIHADFASRELPREKREEYMQKTFANHDMVWAKWDKGEMVQVGAAMLDVFREVTGDIIISTQGAGRSKRDIVEPSLGLLQAVELVADHCEALFTTYYPMVVPPKRWSLDTLNTGAYLTADVRPYPLVKGSKREYKDILRKAVSSGSLDIVLDGVNALQETRWQVNTKVLNVLREVYTRNIPCGSLPRADRRQPDPPPPSLEGRLLVSTRN